MLGIKDYFSFTRGEKRGTVVLLLIIASLIIANLFIDSFRKNVITDFSEFEKAINEFEKGLKSDITPNKTELFKFNPNTISDSDWYRLGFKSWQIKTINNYKTNGGSWKTKNDVSKIYGLEKEYFEQLEPYIELPETIKHNNYSHRNKQSTKPEYFSFNPNTINKEEWQKLGFKEWQIKTIFNYKKKGGKWKTKADVQKIYGLKEATYRKLKPYILLPEQLDRKASKIEKDYSIKVDVNSANEKELTQLKGIHSEKYAFIIIKHRDKIGGFKNMEQLKDVWNMTEETYNGLISQVIIGKYTPKKININSSSIEQLQKHPYIDWKTARAIYKYRKANGLYQDIEELKKIHLINKETYHKIAPYLKLD